MQVVNKFKMNLTEVQWGRVYWIRAVQHRH